jgi:hypothetical protein
MVKERKLKEASGDLEVQKQIFASLKETIGKPNVDPLQPKFREQNVVSSELKIDESSNLCGLELTMVIVCNSNDEIIPNIHWDFDPKMVG